MLVLKSARRVAGWVLSIVVVGPEILTVWGLSNDCRWWSISVCEALERGDGDGRLSRVAGC